MLGAVAGALCQLPLLFVTTILRGKYYKPHFTPEALSHPPSKKRNQGWSQFFLTLKSIPFFNLYFI